MIKFARKSQKSRFLNTMGATDEVVRVSKDDFRRSKALRVIPRGERWLTVHRAHQVTDAMVRVQKEIPGVERLYESSRAVNNG